GLLIPLVPLVPILRVLKLLACVVGGIVRQLTIPMIAPGEHPAWLALRRLRPACCEFPLGLRGKLRSSPPAVVLCVIPAHFDHWMVTLVRRVDLPPPMGRCSVAGGVDECLELLVRDFVLVDVEWFEGSLVPRLLVQGVLFPVFGQSG